jgi:putative hydrolase of the HAD superfamily
MSDGMRLTDFKVLTFDCYGTLIDWESGLVESLKPLTSRMTRDIHRDEILETYARYELVQRTQTPTKLYLNLMATVYKRIAEEWATPVSWDECLRHGQSLKEWPAFTDSAESLAYLKKHYKLVILSNVDNDSFAASNTKLGVTFDAIYTAQDIGSYKPDDNNFRYMIDTLAQSGIDKAEILHTAQSLYHDHEPANRHGLKSCWIDRRHIQGGPGATPPPVEMPHYDFRFCSMAEMVEAHRKQLTE